MIEYLLGIGFEAFHFDTKKMCLVRGSLLLSSLSNLDNRYIHPKTKREVIWGLHEFDKPPTLISPRPLGVITDDEMNNILMNNTPEEVYNMIFKN